MTHEFFINYFFRIRVYSCVFVFRFHDKYGNNIIF